jgi:hypothetical protein
MATRANVQANSFDAAQLTFPFPPLPFLPEEPNSFDVVLGSDITAFIQS